MLDGTKCQNLFSSRAENGREREREREREQLSDKRRARLSGALYYLVPKLDLLLFFISLRCPPTPSPGLLALAMWRHNVG